MISNPGIDSTPVLVRAMEQNFLKMLTEAFTASKVQLFNKTYGSEALEKTWERDSRSEEGSR